MEREEKRSRFALWAFLAWLAVTAMWWALAFAPLPVPPSWLEAARSVCFGTRADGLPEAWGWAGLIVSPLAMLGFLLGVWGSELLAELRRLALRPAGRVGLVALLAVPMLGATWVAQRVADARRYEASLELSTLPDELPESYPRSGQAAPELDLLDQAGDTVSIADLEGRPVLLTFAFAHCQTVCPMLVETLKSAAVELDDVDPALVVVTLDPWRDTPSSLPTLWRSWQLDALESTHVLSGEVDRVLAVLDAWEIPYSRDPKTGDVAHPALIHVLAPDGTIGYTFNAPPVAWVVEAARRVERPELAPAAQSPA